jgi:hypothetical protein
VVWQYRSRAWRGEYLYSRGAGHGSVETLPAPKTFVRIYNFFFFATISGKSILTGSLGGGLMGPSTLAVMLLV